MDTINNKELMNAIEIMKQEKTPQSQNRVIAEILKAKFMCPVILQDVPKGGGKINITKDKGGKWATTSGHPVSGQTSIEGMVTEIKEELGLAVKEEELNFITTVNRKEKFADIYYLEKDVDLNKLNIQKEELDDIKWMTQKEIEELYKAGKFKKTHYNYYKALVSSMKK